MKVLLVLALAAAAYAIEDEPVAVEGARILAHKSPFSMYAVEKMDLVIEYSVFNVGDKPAYKVQLNDVHSFPTTAFDLAKGQLTARWEKLAPGANVTHLVVLQPRGPGVFNYTAAQVTYTTEEKASDYVIGYTNAPGEGYIYLQKEYDRKFAPKLYHWIVFVLIALPFTVGSFLKYTQSASKFEAYMKKEEKKQN
ncbi:unnamed protein product, partial [Mesorhabditis spiculigera]